MRIDLHTHSTASDGTAAARRVVAAAAARRARRRRPDRPRHDRGLGRGRRGGPATRRHAGAGHRDLRAGPTASACTCSAYLHDPAAPALAGRAGAHPRRAGCPRRRRWSSCSRVDIDITWDDVARPGRAGRHRRPPAHRRRAGRRRASCATATRRSTTCCSARPVLRPRTTPRTPCDAVRLVRAAGGVPVWRTRSRTGAGARRRDAVIAELAAAGPGRPRGRPPRPRRADARARCARWPATSACSSPGRATTTARASRTGSARTPPTPEVLDADRGAGDRRRRGRLMDRERVVDAQLLRLESSSRCS